MNVVVHHLKRSRSHRILWLLEELEIPYELREYDRDPETMRAPAALKAVHPLGKSPVVAIDDVVFAESGAITEELVDRADGKLRPAAGSDAHRRFRFFLHYAEGSLMPPLLVRLITGLLRQDKVPWIVRPIAKAIANQIDGSYTNPEVENHTAFLEAELRDRAFVCGDDFTAADVQMSYPVLALLERGSGSAILQAYVARLQERPAYQKAIEVGGPVMLSEG